MRVILMVCFVALAGMAHLGVAVAQTPPPPDPKNEACKKVLLDRAGANIRVSTDACTDLSIYVASQASQVSAVANRMIAGVASVVSARDLQPQQTQKPSLAGTPAQGQADPSIVPTGVAAGTIAMVGTQAGDDAIAALGLNPAVLFLADDASKAVAKYSRFSDVTVFLPVSKLATQNTATPATTKFRYVGVRIRSNFTGLSAGSKLWDETDQLLRGWISNEGAVAAALRPILVTAPDLTGCVKALMDNAAAQTVLGSCGAASPIKVDQASADRIRAEFTALKRQADARYGGADIRIDVGDPTLGAVANSSGTFMFAGFAGGWRSDGPGANYGFSGRFGLRHAKLDSDSSSKMDGEGTLALDMVRSLDDQQLNASIAVDARFGNASAAQSDQYQTNRILARGSFLIPITQGNSASVNVALPIGNRGSPQLSVNFNWGLLLPDKRGP